MSPRLAVDTSVAVPLLSQKHREHAVVRAWAGGRRLALSGHAGAETYSVLTRLPGSLRLVPGDAARLMDHWFDTVLPLDHETVARLPHLLSGLSISGGAVHDAMVALAAKEHGSALATRDARAANTYRSVGVEVVTAG